MFLDKKVLCPLVLGSVFLSACTDYVQQIENEYADAQWYEPVDCSSLKTNGVSVSGRYFSVDNSDKVLRKEAKLSSMQATADQDVRTLDIVIRDFQPNHPDFENFSEESVNHLDEMYNYKSSTGVAMNLSGFDAIWYAAAPYHQTCGNLNTNQLAIGVQIGVDGLPMMPNPYLPGYLQATSAGPVLEYGECAQKSAQGWTQRGYKNALASVSGFKCPGGKSAWANPVIYTPGMVSPYLVFSQQNSDGTLDMFDGVLIRKQNERCDNQHFYEWFSDVPGRNKRVNATMDIPKDPAGSKYYISDYNYNNGGFFPLDSINPMTKEWVMNKPCNPSIQPNGVCDQYEPQTLSIFCPPYSYQYAGSQADFMGKNTANLCKEWLNQGGPRSVNSYNSGHSAAWQAAVSFAARGDNLGLQHLRNYAFTMMGYASFKYKASNQIPLHEVFEFAGDDDMWIFVDGVLVVDLGGTHLPVPGKVDIHTLATNNHGCHAGEPLASFTNCTGASDLTGWADDTWHHLHFFYAERQSDGSNIYIRTSLAELAPSRYGQPSVSSIVVNVDKNGVANNSMFMNVPLADSSLIKINNPNVPSILVLRKQTVLGVDGLPLKNALGEDSTLTMVFGYYVESMTGPIDKGADGQMYQFTGKVKDLAGNVVDGGLLVDDRIAFNVPYSEWLEDDGNGGNYNAYRWAQLMEWSKKINFHIASISGKQVDGFDEIERWGIVESIYCAQ